MGCGKGEFLKLLVAKGIEAIGLDTNHNAIEAARSAGLNAIDADPRDYAASTTEKFDVVCHFQVLEHVPEPLPFLETCAKLLKPDGEIWMATPNQNSFIRYAPFLLLNLPPHHQTRWTASAYQTASQKLDLHLNKLEFEPLHKLHSGWALQSFLNKYFRIGIDRPYIKAECSLWKWAILKFAEMLGKIIFYPKWIRNRIRGHSILVSMGKLNLHPE